MERITQRGALQFKTIRSTLTVTTSNGRISRGTYKKTVDHTTRSQRKPVRPSSKYGTIIGVRGRQTR